MASLPLGLSLIPGLHVMQREGCGLMASWPLPCAPAQRANDEDEGMALGLQRDGEQMDVPVPFLCVCCRSWRRCLPVCLHVGSTVVGNSFVPRCFSPALKCPVLLLCQSWWRPLHPLLVPHHVDLGLLHEWGAWGSVCPLQTLLHVSVGAACGAGAQRAAATQPPAFVLFWRFCS